MSTEELKLSLLKEHTRDKKLTYVAFSLIVLVAILLIVFLGRFLLDMFLSEQALYPKIMLGVALFGYICYAVWKIMKLNARQKDIEELLQKVQAGAKALNIAEFKEYKIIVPLGKTTYKMYPVEYCKFALDCDMAKSYTVAVHPVFIAEFKTLLSGVNLDLINEKLDDIYGDGRADEAGTSHEAAAMQQQEAYADEDTPIKSIEEYREFLTVELGDTISAIEDSRSKGQKLTKMFMPAVIIVAVAWMGYVIYKGVSSEGSFSVTSIIIPMAVLFGGYYLYYFMFMKPRIKAAGGLEMTSNGQFVTTADHEFKTKLLEKIIKFVSPGAQYVMHGHVSVGELMASGMFKEANYKITGNDLIIGRHRGVPFQFCDLTVEVQKRVKRENEENDYALYGQFFVARFNKSFSSPVYVFPRTGVKGLFTGNEASMYTEHTGEKIQLEDPDFMKMFNVYGEDQIEARYILTPAMMERIKELAKRTKGEYFISFYDNRITVANNSGKNNLEMNGKKSLTANDNKVLVDFYYQLCDQFALIDDLKLNIKIWK